MARFKIGDRVVIAPSVKRGRIVKWLNTEGWWTIRLDSRKRLMLVHDDQVFAETERNIEGLRRTYNVPASNDKDC